MIWLWWAPLATTTLHIVEEFVYPGGFAAWDRRYRPEISKSITGRLHVIVNAALLLACIQIGALAKATDAELQFIGIPAWMALTALLFSNAVYHVLGTIQTRVYSPGLITAIGLYVPLCIFGYWYFLREGQVSWVSAVVAALLGGSYHFWAALLHNVRSRRKD